MGKIKAQYVYIYVPTRPFLQAQAENERNKEKVKLSRFTIIDILWEIIPNLDFTGCAHPSFRFRYNISGIKIRRLRILVTVRTLIKSPIVYG